MLSDSIKFTVEVECEQELPFLDILARRIGFNLECSIYRKPTNKNALHFSLFMKK